MNIEQFKVTYAHLKDVDQIKVDDVCSHPLHINEAKEIAKGPARKNILKHGGKEFICRSCHLKHDNPMNQSGPLRQTDEEIIVYCPCEDHVGEKSRKIRRSGYFGDFTEPYSQVCKSCAQRGKEISKEQREKISMSLSGIPKSEEFKKNLSDYMKNNKEAIARATNNLFKNHCNTGMLGKNHSEEAKRKQSEAMTGRKYSEEHKKNISEGRKKMLAETGGFTKEHREKLSAVTKRNTQSGFDPNKYHRKGWHNSPKAGDVFYHSSYEKKAFILLDEMSEVKTYNVEATKIKYFNPTKNINGTYFVDIDVWFVDGTHKLIEVKPKKLLDDKTVKVKCEAAKAYAEQNNLIFEIWTELELFGQNYTMNQIFEFTNGLDTSNRKDKIKENTQKKSKKHYDIKIAIDKVQVFCEYCQETHNPLRITYEANIARNNGKYICEKHGGFISGSKPKLKLRKVNPYAAEGKKQCNGIDCKQVKPFEEFDLDSSKIDGRTTLCKTCRRKKQKERDEKKKLEKKTSEDTPK